LVKEEGARNPLRELFNYYIEHLKGFGDPFTEALDPANKLRSQVETALGLLYDLEQRPLIEKKFESYFNRIKNFDDPFTAEWDPTDDRRLNIIATADSSPEPKPLSTRYFHNNALLILEGLKEIHNETLPRLVLFQDKSIN
jgi:hypothetical protein